MLGNNIDYLVHCTAKNTRQLQWHSRFSLPNGIKSNRPKTKKQDPNADYLAFSYGHTITY